MPAINLFLSATGPAGRFEYPGEGSARACRRRLDALASALGHALIGSAFGPSHVWVGRGRPIQTGGKSRRSHAGLSLDGASFFFGNFANFPRTFRANPMLRLGL
jgi:hypothetical protein